MIRYLHFSVRFGGWKLEGSMCFSRKSGGENEMCIFLQWVSGRKERNWNVYLQWIYPFKLLLYRRFSLWILDFCNSGQFSLYVQDITGILEVGRRKISGDPSLRQISGDPSVKYTATTALHINVCAQSIILGFHGWSYPRTVIKLSLPFLRGELPL